MEVTESSVGGGPIKYEPRDGRVPPALGSSPGLPAPRAPPRAGGDRGLDQRGGAPTGRARCSARVSRGRYARRSARVHAPSQLDARDARNAGNRGRDSSPVLPRVHAHPAPPPPPACSLGPAGRAEGGSWKVRAGRLCAGRQGNAARLPAGPPPACCCGELGPPWGGRLGCTGSALKSAEFYLLTFPISHSSAPLRPSPRPPVP